MLGSFMHASNLQNLPNLQHSDVLEKLKMQVGLMDSEFAMNSLNPSNGAFTLPQGAAANLTNAAAQQNGFTFLPPNAPHTKDGKFQ